MPSVERSVVIPASKDDVWEAITNPADLSAWFGADVDIELRPGGAADFQTDDGTHRRGLVEEVDEGRRLAFRWWPLGTADVTRVQITLDDGPDGTEVTVVETVASAARSGLALACA